MTSKFNNMEIGAVERKDLESFEGEKSGISDDNDSAIFGVLYCSIDNGVNGPRDDVTILSSDEEYTDVEEDELERASNHWEHERNSGDTSTEESNEYIESLRHVLADKKRTIHEMSNYLIAIRLELDEKDDEINLLKKTCSNNLKQVINIDDDYEDDNNKNVSGNNGGRQELEGKKIIDNDTALNQQISDLKKENACLKNRLQDVESSHEELELLLDDGAKIENLHNKAFKKIEKERGDLRFQISELNNKVTDFETRSRLKDIDQMKGRLDLEKSEERYNNARTEIAVKIGEKESLEEELTVRISKVYVEVQDLVDEMKTKDEDLTKKGLEIETLTRKLSTHNASCVEEKELNRWKTRCRDEVDRVARRDKIIARLGEKLETFESFRKRLETKKQSSSSSTQTIQYDETVDSNFRALQRELDVTTAELELLNKSKTDSESRLSKDNGYLHELLASRDSDRRALRREVAAQSAELELVNKTKTESEFYLREDNVHLRERIDMFSSKLQQATQTCQNERQMHLALRQRHDEVLCRFQSIQTEQFAMESMQTQSFGRSDFRQTSKFHWFQKMNALQAERDQFQDLYKSLTTRISDLVSRNMLLENRLKTPSEEKTQKASNNSDSNIEHTSPAFFVQLLNDISVGFHSELNLPYRQSKSVLSQHLLNMLNNARLKVSDAFSADVFSSEANKSPISLYGTTDVNNNNKHTNESEFSSRFVNPPNAALGKAPEIHSFVTKTQANKAQESMPQRVLNNCSSANCRTKRRGRKRKLPMRKARESGEFVRETRKERRKEKKLIKVHMLIEPYILNERPCSTDLAAVEDILTKKTKLVRTRKEGPGCKRPCPWTSPNRNHNSSLSDREPCNNKRLTVKQRLTMKQRSLLDKIERPKSDKKQRRARVGLEGQVNPPPYQIFEKSLVEIENFGNPPSAALGKAPDSNLDTITETETLTRNSNAQSMWKTNTFAPTIFEYSTKKGQKAQKVNWAQKKSTKKGQKAQKVNWTPTKSTNLQSLRESRDAIKFGIEANNSTVDEFDKDVKIRRVEKVVETSDFLQTPLNTISVDNDKTSKSTLPMSLLEATSTSKNDLKDENQMPNIDTKMRNIVEETKKKPSLKNSDILGKRSTSIKIEVPTFNEDLSKDQNKLRINAGFTKSDKGEINKLVSDETVMSVSNNDHITEGQFHFPVPLKSEIKTESDFEIGTTTTTLVTSNGNITSNVNIASNLNITSESSITKVNDTNIEPASSEDAMSAKVIKTEKNFQNVDKTATFSKKSFVTSIANESGNGDWYPYGTVTQQRNIPVLVTSSIYTLNSHKTELSENSTSMTVLENSRKKNDASKEARAESERSSKTVAATSVPWSVVPTWPIVMARVEFSKASADSSHRLNETYKNDSNAG